LAAVVIGTPHLGTSPCPRSHIIWKYHAACCGQSLAWSIEWWVDHCPRSRA